MTLESVRHISLRRCDLCLAVLLTDECAIDEFKGAISVGNQQSKNLDRMGFGREEIRKNARSEQISQNDLVHMLDIDLDVMRLSILPDYVGCLPLRNFDGIKFMPLRRF